MSIFSTLAAVLLVTPSLANNWSTYPHVPKTASINGFADPIFPKLPECAQGCVKKSVDNTPCPYWDTGCICIMPQWIDPVASCIAASCSGNQVETATSLANSLCTRVGAWWSVAASDSSELSQAALRGAAASATQSPASATSSNIAAAATTGSSSSSSGSKSSSTAPSSKQSSDKKKNGATVKGFAIVGAIVGGAVAVAL